MFQLAQIITGKSEKDLFTVLALKADIILFFAVKEKLPPWQIFHTRG